MFQYGIGAELLGFQEIDTIEAWVPLFLFSVLFGLSMDYQVFLLSRIKERYDETGDTTDAVTFGVGSTARIITGAALIIVAVFSGFARGDLIMFQQMGFGVAVALLIDATIIRSVLLPSVMRLLGRLELVPADAGSSGCHGCRSKARHRRAAARERWSRAGTRAAFESRWYRRRVVTRRVRIAGTLVLTALAVAYLAWKIELGTTLDVLAGDRPVVVRRVRRDHGADSSGARGPLGLAPPAQGIEEGLAVADPGLFRRLHGRAGAAHVARRRCGADRRDRPPARGRTAVVTGTVVLERGLGGAATVLLGALAFVLSIGRFDVSAYFWIEGIFVFGTIVLAFLFFARSARPFLRRAEPLLERVRLDRVAARVLRERPPLPRQAAPAARGVRRHVRGADGTGPRDLGRGEGCRHRARGARLLRMGPLLFLVLLVPFTLNGIAVREAFFVSFLGSLGVGAEQAFAAGFLFFLVTLIMALPGAVVLLWEGLGGGTRPRVEHG